MALLLVSLAVAAGFGVFIWCIQPKLRVTHIDLPIEDLPAELEGFKIAHLTDIHYDLPRRNTMTEELLAEIIETTNAELPDLICLTGDYINRDPLPAAELAQKLAALRASKGVVAVLGNHDHKEGGHIVQGHLEAANITVLTNSCLSIPSLPLVVVGFDDLWARRFLPAVAQPLLEEELRKIPGKAAVIGLSHNPDTADALATWPIDLLLSGHTHGGQIRVPLIDVPLIKIFRAIWKMLPALFRPLVPGSQHFGAVREWDRSAGLIPIRSPDGRNTVPLYVSRGLGSHTFLKIRLRLFCDPEIAVFTLKRA